MKKIDWLVLIVSSVTLASNTSYMYFRSVFCGGHPEYTVIDNTWFIVNMALGVVTVILCYFANRHGGQ